MNFSVPHLLAASQLSREAKRIEDDNAGNEFGPFFEQVLGSCVGCVVRAVAGVESYANEIFADGKTNFPGQDRTILDMLWREYEQKPVIVKFDLAMQLRGSEHLDKGGRTVQAMDRLVRLRNALMHFKPEWSDEALEHEKLSKKLDGYVSRSPWFPDENLFPRSWASKGTTAWAVKTAVSFITEFSRLSGIDDRFAELRTG